MFMTALKASGGSGESGRGIGRENLGLIALRRENEPTAWESVRQGTARPMRWWRPEAHQRSNDLWGIARNL